MSKTKTEDLGGKLPTSVRPKYLDRLPAGWFVLDVMPETDGSRIWVALLVDVDPDKPGFRTAREAWFRLPGEYSTYNNKKGWDRNREKAWKDLQEMMITRH
jgi:hypothetical protein